MRVIFTKPLDGNLLCETCPPIKMLISANCPPIKRVMSSYYFINLANTDQHTTTTLLKLACNRGKYLALCTLVFGAHNGLPGGILGSVQPLESRYMSLLRLIP